MSYPLNDTVRYILSGGLLSELEPDNAGTVTCTYAMQKKTDAHVRRPQKEGYFIHRNYRILVKGTSLNYIKNVDALMIHRKQWPMEGNP